MKGKGDLIKWMCPVLVVFFGWDRATTLRERQRDSFETGSRRATVTSSGRVVSGWTAVSCLTCVRWRCDNTNLKLEVWREFIGFFICSIWVDHRRLLLPLLLGCTLERCVRRQSKWRVQKTHTHPDRKAGIQKLSHSHAQTKSSKNQYCNPPNLLCGGLCGLENSRVCCSPTAVGVSEDDVLSPHTAFLLALYLNTRSSLQL